MSKGFQIALGAGVVALLLGWYAASNLDSMGSFQYFQTLDEFQESGELGMRVRVHGYVAPGSIIRDVDAKSVHFAVQNDSPHKTGPTPDPLQVLYPGLDTPDLFKDGAEVILEGGLTHADGRVYFHADNVLAKCPSKFEAQRTEKAPFSMPGGA